MIVQCPGNSRSSQVQPFGDFFYGWGIGHLAFYIIKVAEKNFLLTLNHAVP
jgi:hypothetical protein